MTRKPLVAIACLVLAAVPLGVWGLIEATRPAKTERQAAAVPVVLASIEPREWVTRVEAIGTAQANESVVLAAKATARVARLGFEDGQLVKEGDVLVELVAQEEQALLLQEQATLREEEARLTVEKQTLEALQSGLAEAMASYTEQQNHLVRITDLHRRKSVTDAQYDEQVSLAETARAKAESARARIRAAEAQIASVEARVEAARARITAVEAQLAELRLVAPFAGMLGFRKLSVGAVVAPGTEVATLDDIRTIKLDFPVPEKHMDALHVGLLVEARGIAYPDRVFQGQVESIDSRIDPVTRSVVVRARLDNADLLLRPGMLFTVDLISQRRSALAVPEEAIVPLGGQQFVYVIDAQRRARRVEIEIGERQIGVVEVLGGLKAGQQVVVEGTTRLAPGAAVEVVEVRPGKETRVEDQPAAIAQGGVGR